MKNASVPKEAVTIYNKALVLSNKGLFEGAINEYRKAISIYPRFLEAYNNMGEIYSKLGDKEKAISVYLEALSIDRNHRVLLNLGVEYYNSGNYRAALSHFNESLSGNDDFLEGHFYAGMAYFNLKDYRSAEVHFLKTISLDQRHEKANYVLSYIYYEQKDYPRAIECLDRIKDTFSDQVFVKKYYGFCLFHMGKYDEAINYLISALENSPMYSKFREYLKSLTVENKMKEIGDLEARIDEMEKRMLTKEMPTIRECTQLSMLYIFNGDYKKAEEMLQSYKKKLH